MKIKEIGSVKSEIAIEEYSTHYGHTFHCGNCGHRTHRYIQKGVPVKDVSVKCDNCGCKV